MPSGKTPKRVSSPVEDKEDENEEEGNGAGTGEENEEEKEEEGGTGEEMVLKADNENFSTHDDYFEFDGYGNLRSYANINDALEMYEDVL